MQIKNVFKGRFAARFLSAGCAYAVAVTGLVGFGSADAASLREVPSSICHAKNDNIGTTLENAGALKNTGTGSVSIYCPVVSDGAQYASDVDSIAVYGREGTDGAYSATCSCYASIVDCTCSATKAWVNNSGTVATGISLTEWAQGRDNEFRWMLHRLTPNSTLIGFSMAAN